MKALAKLKKQPGIGMINDAPIPEYGYNDVLIKIKKTASCGTDLHIYTWDKWSQNTSPVPMITGHEFAGE
ncbi:alcohol dehydrogenase catalytic domain-containing protein, partial [Francisella tularensis subsp. holarctica]|uniref:alcohol dehydrogenase catalytic domain-containing protein n=1 Tax=Francisella tularensis TaxID=263 RepID=UPI002381AFAF